MCLSRTMNIYKYSVVENDVKLLVCLWLKNNLVFCLWLVQPESDYQYGQMLLLENSQFWKMWSWLKFLNWIGFGFHSNGHRLVHPFSGASGHAFLWLFSLFVFCISSPKFHYTSAKLFLILIIKLTCFFSLLLFLWAGYSKFWCAFKTSVWDEESHTHVEMAQDNANHPQP